MSFKDFFFSNSRNRSTNILAWERLNGVGQLKEFINLPSDKKVIIFKHSPRCGISSTVLRRFEARLMDKGNNDLVFLVNVLSDRELSKALAEKFKITHQSPQVLIIKNEKLLRHASHYDILDLDID